ncbi:MAG: cobyric acid synthase [Thermoprotei archaeon]
MLLVASTTSDSGKSTIVSALVRYLNAYPFKAQNMSLNSYPTKDGGEIAFIQAFQAMASGREPERGMNAILLKPSGNGRVEVVHYGTPLGAFSYSEYYETVLPKLRGSIRLREDMVVEGAGGIEPNFLERDLATVEIMRRGAPTILVLNVDPGGAFTSAYGAYLALPPSLRDRLKGFVINKLRGDPKFLESGVRWLEERTGMKYLGYLPYSDELSIMPEDSMNLRDFGEGEVEVAVVAYNYVSNFNELWALKGSEVSVRFVRSPKQLAKADLVVLPGAKNTLEAIKWLRERMFEDYLKKKKLFAVCGGYQVLTRRMTDEYGLEFGSVASVSGLGLIPQEVVYKREKVIAISEAKLSNFRLKGYEIRRGRIVGEEFHGEIIKRNGEGLSIPDGYYDGKVFATSLHGSLFSEGGKKAFEEMTGVKLAPGSLEEEAEKTAERIVRVMKETVYLDEIRELWLGVS